MSERSYSSARRLNTRLRSRMGDERFSDLAVLDGHKQRTESVYLNSHRSLLLATRTARETLALQKVATSTVSDGIPSVNA